MGPFRAYFVSEVTLYKCTYNLNMHTYIFKQTLKMFKNSCFFNMPAVYKVQKDKWGLMAIVTTG